jgi:hypothetical protein
MTKTPAKLEAQAEASRQALQDDVQALKEKVRPKRMAQDAARTIGTRGRKLAYQARDRGGRLAAQAARGSQRMAGKVARQAKEDPFPFVVGGAIAGAALIIGLSRRGGRRELIGPR